MAFSWLCVLAPSRETHLPSAQIRVHLRSSRFPKFALPCGLRDCSPSSRGTLIAGLTDRRVQVLLLPHGKNIDYKQGPNNGSLLTPAELEHDASGLGAMRGRVGPGAASAQDFGSLRLGVW